MLRRSDDELVARTRAGNRRALAELLQRHQGPLRACAAALAPQPDRADDIAQESVLRAIRQLDHYQGPERFGPWLRGIARNVAREQWRAVLHEAGPVTEVDALTRFTEDAVADAFDAQRDRELAALRLCIATLDEWYRRLLDLRFRLGLGSAAIAATLGRQPGSVRASLSRVYRRLGDCMRTRLAEGPDGGQLP